MSISDDTAALVAAQLTVAWVQRQPSTLPGSPTELFRLYQHLKDMVDEDRTEGAMKVPASGA